MQNINTNELFPLRNSNYKLATLLLVVLIAYALYTAFYHCVKLSHSNTMASQKQGQKDSRQYSVYHPPTSNLDLLRTRGGKYETHPHPTGQRWGDKVRCDYENHQQSNKTPPVTTSTDAMDTEEVMQLPK